MMVVDKDFGKSIVPVDHTAANEWVGSTPGHCQLLTAFGDLAKADDRRV
ncbi:MAG TPA: hypothetical protein VII92_13775 [Anaerolineae bacterium]